MAVAVRDRNVADRVVDVSHPREAPALVAVVVQVLRPGLSTFRDLPASLGDHEILVELVGDGDAEALQGGFVHLRLAARGELSRLPAVDLDEPVRDVVPAVRVEFDQFDLGVRGSLRDVLPHAGRTALAAHSPLRRDLAVADEPGPGAVEQDLLKSPRVVREGYDQVAKVLLLNRPTVALLLG